MRKAKKLYAAIALALAAMLVASTAAMAAVQFDPTNGTGFIGKGDVQLAFGWNNKELQSNASGVTFTYTEETEYEAVCTWVTGEGTRGEKTHNVKHKKSSDVTSTVDYDPRVKNQITGFTLKGFGASTSEGEEPVVGGACQGEGAGGTWSSVTELGSSGGELFVNHGGTSVSIWTPAAPPAV